jgi:choline dehydrogenase
MPDSNERADVLIVGGGSAGAVLAARLTEDSARTVLLLEAGPAYGLDEIPEGVLGAAHVADHDHDWGYTSWGNHDQRTVPAPRGKVLGGSSSVNASVAIRPRPSDLAKWASHGAEGWSYEEVLPAFRDLENTPYGEDHYHGRSGPLGSDVMPWAVVDSVGASKESSACASLTPRSSLKCRRPSPTSP